MNSFDIIAVLLVGGLIGYRVAKAIVSDKVGAPVRRLVERVTNRGPGTWWAKLLTNLFGCQQCLGFWVTIAVTLGVSTALADLDWITDLTLAVAATGLQSLLAAHAAGMTKVDTELEELAED